MSADLQPFRIHFTDADGVGSSTLVHAASPADARKAFASRPAHAGFRIRKTKLDREKDHG
jgi:hypothetical protein